MGLPVSISDPGADPCGGQTAVMGPQAVDTGVKGKWAGGSTFPETWEKQLGEGSMEHKAHDTPDLQGDTCRIHIHSYEG